jgi:predicted flap endonuclease-1-like 5' DNA nuclease
MQQLNFESWIAQAMAFSQTRSTQIGDDLTMLEGIGPIYAARLRDNGITTFAELASTDEARLAEIIDAPAWRRIEYGDWITQARLAAEGDTSGLKDVQDQLFRREGENLQLIHGLGERSAAALQAAGITSFMALAAATPDQLEAIIHNAGVRGDFDYESWITEANLRASGRRISRERPVPTHVVSCPQDLSAVEGIGSVYEDRLYDAGIGSYWELAETPAHDLAGILGLQSFQDVDLTAIKASAMQMAVQSNSLGRSWDGSPPDNFENIPGLGEVYERRLYEAGICTFDALAATTYDSLADICQAPPMRTPDYNAWIATATALVEARRSG